MARAALAALLSHWARHRVQLAMLVLGLSLATALWSGVQAINAEARASYDRAAGILGGNRLTALVDPAGAIDMARFVALRRAGWLVSPVIEGEAAIGTARVRVLGIDPLTLPAGAAEVDVAATGDLAGFLRAPGQLFAAAATLAALKGQTDSALVLAADLPEGVVVTDLAVAQQLLGMQGRVSRLLVAPEQPLGRLPLPDVAPDLELRAPDTSGDMARLTDSFHLNLTAFGYLAFAVGLFIVHSAIGLAFEQRRGVFRTLRALGLPLRALMAVLVAELVLLALVAGLIGVALGYGVAAALLPDVAATLRGLYGAEIAGSLAVRPGVWAAGIGIAVAGTLASAAQNLWRVWSMPLLAPARPRAWAHGSEQLLVWQAAAAAGLFVLAIGLGVWGSGLVAGFGLLGALLLGSACALPVVLAGALALGQRLARGPVAQWFWADARQQLPGLSLALVALMLALATNLGVGTMVSSFRATFTGWLDQRLASEVYVLARSGAEAGAMRDWARGRVDAVLPIALVTATVAGRPVELYGVADHATYRDNWPMLQGLPMVWDRIAAGQGALINEQMFYATGLQLGTSVELAPGWSVPVVGVYSDYGNMSGQMIVGIEPLLARYPEAEPLRFGLRLDPAGVPALAEALRQDFGLPGENIVDQAAIKAQALSVFERTFTVTAALNVLTLGVAGLAMFANLLTLAGMRLPQLAPVWASGMTRRDLARLELARTLMLAGVTLVAALPVGLGLAWVLLAVVNVEAFGWRLPLFLFPLDWLKLGGWALLAAALAAWVPVRRLALIAPSDLLRVFAHER